MNALDSARHVKVKVTWHITRLSQIDPHVNVAAQTKACTMFHLIHLHIAKIRSKTNIQMMLTTSSNISYGNRRQRKWQTSPSQFNELTELLSIFSWYCMQKLNAS
jgi:hypothetical protein